MIWLPRRPSGLIEPLERTLGGGGGGLGLVFAVMLAAIGVVPRPAAAASTYYVAPTGSDGASGVMAAPFATIAHAQAVAAPGDTVYFRGGTHVYTSGTPRAAAVPPP
jgi:hypothetical protein